MKQPANRHLPSVQTDSEEVLSQYQQTLEELQVAEEELRQQNEVLIANSTALEEQRQMLQELFEFAPDGYLITDLSGIIKRANLAAATLLNTPKDRLIDKPLAVYFGQENAAFYAALEPLRDGQALSDWEMQLQPRRGEPIQVLINVAAYRREGVVTSLHWLLRDFTALHRARHALQLSEARYRAIIEDQTELVCRFRPDGTLTFVNGAFCRFFEQSADELINRSLFSLLPRQEWAAVRKRLASLTPDQPTITFELRIHFADGAIGWQQWTDRAIFDETGRCLEIQAVGHCITELKRREQELQRSREKLRSLAAYQQSVREEERTAIAREIHDALGQELTALKIGLARLQSDAASRHGEIALLIDSVDKMLADVQRIATELRPALLDDLGLVAAIEWQTEQFSKRTGILCRLDLVQDDIVTNDEQNTALFRILQEALTNIARHAAASQVRISLRQHRDNLQLRVEDNGKGITEQQIDAPRSLGLLGMRERVHGLGGELHIARGPSGGTRIRASLPL